MRALWSVGFAVALLCLGAIAAFADELPPPDITLKLAPGEVGAVWSALAERPAKDVLGLMLKIQGQVQAQASVPPKLPEKKPETDNGKK